VQPRGCRAHRLPTAPHPSPEMRDVGVSPRYKISNAQCRIRVNKQPRWYKNDAPDAETRSKRTMGDYVNRCRQFFRQLATRSMALVNDPHRQQEAVNSGTQAGHWHIGIMKCSYAAGRRWPTVRVRAKTADDGNAANCTQLSRS